LRLCVGVARVVGFWGPAYYNSYKLIFAKLRYNRSAPVVSNHARCFRVRQEVTVNLDRNVRPLRGAFVPRHHRNWRWLRRGISL
jgi:hypothetical protein